MRYAHCEIQEEFDSKNLIKDAQGVRAVGVDLEDSLPGLYWLNYFGRPYVQMIGKQKLLAAAAYEVHDLKDGVLIKLSSTPFEWQGEAYQSSEQLITKHIGTEFFFSKTDLTRNTIAPDFRGELKSRAK